MKKILIILLTSILFPMLSFAYDPIYTNNSPGNLGDVPVMHDGDGIPSTMTRWKSSRIRATQSGFATHFIIRVGSNNVGSVPVGFAVYAGSSGERDPIGRLLIRGYYPSFNFTSAGYYALPFTSAESIEIVAGNYYHLVYLLTAGDPAAESGWRINESSPPPKWFSNCKGSSCDANEPPGIGGEYWNDQYWPSSAGWTMGLLDGRNAAGNETQYPTIDITSPVTGSRYSTSQNTVDISGQASDDSGVVSVSWSNNRGGSGNATNTSGDWSSWSVPGIALQEGENQITVTVTDSTGQTTTDSLTVTLSASGTTAKAYDANNMTGDSTWENSYATYCARLLVPGSQISQSGNTIQLGFQGRNSGDYTIQRVSIAERDPNGSNGDIIDSTFTKITFDKKGEIYHENLAADSWENYDVVVPENTEKVSNTIQFNIDPGKDYYVTFSIQSPSVYLEPPSGYEELYIQGADNALHLDWSGIAYRVVRDYHALSSIYISNQPANPKGAH